MNQGIKKRLFEILEIAAPGDHASRAFDIFIMSLISLNVLAVIIETVESISGQYESFFKIFEVISVLIFTIEYILRLWTCNEDEKYKGSFGGRVRFALTPLALVDLFAILPFYIPMVIPLDLRFIRAIRLFRIFRLFKIGRYSTSLKTISNVLKNKKEELMITSFTVCVLLVIASSLMYFVERGSQPEVFSSIPAAIWWGIVTLTTVGYGDIFPSTVIGKMLGGIIALLGIGLFALPAGIIASGFSEELQDKRDSVCPHCGGEISDRQ